MPDTKIQNLSEDTAPALTDVTVGVKDPAGTPLDRKLTWQTVWNLLTSLTAKTSIVDADKLSLADSAASFVAKAITWFNLRATMHSFATTATAAGTTTLTVTSARKQVFTGTTTQTITLPVVSTLFVGYPFTIINNSTGALTVNSSGGNLVVTIPAGGTAELVAVLITGTTAASWDATLTLIQGPSGTYTPTNLNSGSNVNVATLGFFATNYLRFNDMVMVAGRIDIDPTAAGALSFQMSIPIASDFASTINASGTINSDSTDFGRIVADATNNDVTISINAVNTAAHSFNFVMIYQVM